MKKMREAPSPPATARNAVVGTGSRTDAVALRASGSRRGFSIVEVLVVASLTMVALVAISGVLGKSIDLNEVNRETARATDGLREMMEVLQGFEEFPRLYATYNAWPDDDPDGPDTAPGNGFAVPGLSPVAGDEDGLVGEIVFPTFEGDFGPELREDVDDATLGMPRDLSGNGLVDIGVNYADDYRLLPVALRLRWEGASGERTMEIRTLIADR
jgi:hypothetical protein